MIITISGLPGSGNTTVSKIIAKMLGYKYYSIGGMRRKMALDKGMTLAELNNLGESEFSTDDYVDKYQKKLGETEDNIIVDAKIGYFFIPKSVKVFLKADIRERAERILKEKREEENSDSVEDAVTKLKKRMESDRKRYKKYYNTDCYDESNFDIVIDTSKITAEQAVDKIMEFIKKR